MAAAAAAAAAAEAEAVAPKNVSLLTEIIAVYRPLCCGPSASLNELNYIMIQHV